MSNIAIAAWVAFLVTIVAILRARHLRRSRLRPSRTASRDPEEEVAASVLQLARVKSPEASVAASARVRNAIGDDHCGVVFPVAVPAVRRLVDIAVNGPEREGRVAALGVLTDIFWWGPEEPWDAVRREVMAHAETLRLAAGTEGAGSTLKYAFAELLGEVEDYSRQLTLGVQVPSAPFLRKLTVSRELAEVIGDGPLSRMDVVKKLWAYIRKNNLQDSKERRMIVADEKLRAVFGGKDRVSMFEMTKLVNAHLGELDAPGPQKPQDG
jgi:hypothetical protein